MRSNPGLWIVVVIVSVASFASCSTQKTAVTSNGEECRVDASAVCYEIRNDPVVFAGTGETADLRRQAENGSRTSEITVPRRMPSGAMIEFDCYINTVHRSVVYAKILSMPKLSDRDIGYLRNRGYCKQ